MNKTLQWGEPLGQPLSPGATRDPSRTDIDRKSAV